ncbi:MAG: aminomethyl-transferring glycine dehydrogenase subunit GcvPB [Clostridiales bacterium]|nr:aminomethyl-transferring glycine dehydrogenase subunit GcvPB [Clostridiales bacterium]
MMPKDIPLIFEISKPGRKAYSLPEPDVPFAGEAALLPESALRREAARLPEVSELDVVRHYTRLSQQNHGVESGFYPLGSCTMKYNPKLNEDMAAMPGFSKIHPYQPLQTVQGALRLIYELEQTLAEISGMARVSMMPAAGAHGEMLGLMIIKAYHQAKGDEKRDKIIVPDAAHGTNPASVMMAGFKTVQIPSNERGGVDMEALKAAIDETTAGLMLTNPNTLGLFDENISEIAEIIHAAGGLLYYDGANQNAIMGISRPGDMGFDIIHLNLHKTFSTPHGGGGPGSGPVGVKEELIPFLPAPLVDCDCGEGFCENGNYTLTTPGPLSIGRIRSFYANFLVLVRAYTYIRSMGPDGLLEASQGAVLNANYLMAKLKDDYHLPYDRVCMHECVFSGKKQKENGVSTLDIAKRLLDFGYHPPTVYFPLIVDEALMIEPTESESKDTLDEFITAMQSIAQEAKSDPQALKEAPHSTPVRRLDEAGAARNPVLRWKP